MRIQFPRGAVPAGVAFLVAISLSGCISLLPKTTPAQLYRFGADSAAVAPAPTAGPRFTVRPAFISFEHAAAGDRILTITGNQAAYIGGARWVGPAGSLFEAAVTRAFDVHGGPARLLAAGEPAPGDYVLKVDVRAFEVRYDKGPDSAPRAVVEVYAALSDRKDARIESSRLFQVTTPAESNSVHAIAAALDDVVVKALTQLVAWVDNKGQA
jgi:cholesterol transport system auxiliary component